MHWRKKIKGHLLWFITACLVLFGSLGFALLNLEPDQIRSLHAEPFEPPFQSQLLKRFPESLPLLYNKEVVYTLDGTEPQLLSDHALGSFNIQSLDFYNQLQSYLSAISSSPIWKAPSRLKDKGLVLKMASLDEEQRLSTTATRQLLKDPFEEGGPRLPVVGLVISKTDFLDHHDGIFIQGREYYKKRSLKDSRLDKPLWYKYWKLPANYHQRGQQSRRKIFISYFDEHGKLAYESEGMFRLKGDASRALPQKALLISPKDEITNTELFESQESYQLDKILLRGSGGDFIHTLLRDALAQRILAHSSLDQQAYQPAISYINGEYWGLQNIREELDIEHLMGKYAVNRADLEYLELSLSKYQEEEHYREWKKSIQRIAESETDSIRFSSLCEAFDITQLIEYFSFQSFIANTDWPNNNVKVYRISGDHTFGGKWRFIVYDTDFAFGGSGDKRAYQTSMHEHIYDSKSPLSDLYKLAMGIPQFKDAYLHGYSQALDSEYASDKLLIEWEKVHQKIRPFMNDHIERWSIPESIEKWEQNLGIVDTFLQNRSSFVRKELEMISKDYISEDE